MTIREFESTVNILISQHRKLHAIKFMRECCGDSTKWLKLSDIKNSIVDNASHEMNTAGKLFVIKDYKQFSPNVIRRIRGKSSKVYVKYVRYSIDKIRSYMFDPRLSRNHG